MSHLTDMLGRVTCTHLPPSIRRVPSSAQDERSSVWAGKRICLECHADANLQMSRRLDLYDIACDEECGDGLTLIITLMRCDECGERMNTLQLHGSGVKYFLPVRVSALCIREGVQCLHCMDNHGLIQAVTIVTEKVNDESLS